MILGKTDYLVWEVSLVDDYSRFPSHGRFYTAAVPVTGGGIGIMEWPTDNPEISCKYNVSNLEIFLKCV